MIGMLRSRLTLQEPVRTPDGGGGFTTVFENVTANPVVFARITQVSGAESMNSGSLSSRTVYRIILRYRGDVTPQMRLIDGDTVYAITSVVAINDRRNYLEIVAERQP